MSGRSFDAPVAGEAESGGQVVRYGVIADIHGCGEALRDVLAALEGRVAEILCLGDLVGDGEESAACVEEARRRDLRCVLGPRDARALKTGRPALSDESVRWLRGLPTDRRHAGMMLVHDNPIARRRLAKGLWRRGTAVRHLLAAQVVFEEAAVFREDPQALVLIGDTHVPAVYSPQADLPLAEGNSVVLRPGTPYLLNPGAVGYSSDGRSACAGIVDPEERTFTVIRVATRTRLQADYRPPGA